MVKNVPEGLKYSCRSIHRLLLHNPLLRITLAMLPQHLLILGAKMDEGWHNFAHHGGLGEGFCSGQVCPSYMFQGAQTALFIVELYWDGKESITLQDPDLLIGPQVGLLRDTEMLMAGVSQMWVSSAGHHWCLGTSPCMWGLLEAPFIHPHGRKLTAHMNEQWPEEPGPLDHPCHTVLARKRG